MRATILALAWTAVVAVLLGAQPAINAWERSRGYPYGRMCDSIFTGFEDTCPKGAR